jgi:asparagine synthase (glutamine-hydrolysing)
MCGLLGMIDTPWNDDFDAALDTLTPRGPDERGVWQRESVAMGHRRLSIIDLVSGHQPMATSDGRYVLIYNGEIYNFQQLRHDLEKQGVTFTTRSDTEVLLHMLVKRGVDALRDLDGMFAFALWDTVEQRLFAARDRFGIKPLFYAHGKGLVIASTLAPFEKMKKFKRELDFNAVRDYLATGVIPAPLTIWQETRALLPAHWLKWDRKSGGIKTGLYWNIPRPCDNAMPFEDLVNEMDAALAESVRRQLVADVPLGAFLSGGIDSSLMIHYMAAAQSKPVKTFSVRFGGPSRYDESKYANIVAKQYSTDHIQIDAEELDAAALEEAVDAMDQPFADAALLPTMALSRIARQHVTVAVSGDGGDELLGGYTRFLETQDTYPPSWYQPLMRRAVETGLLPGSLYRRTISGKDRVIWNRLRLGPFARSRKDMTRFLQADVDVNDTLRGWIDSVKSFGQGFDSDSLMRADLWTYLADDCLAKTDRASMLSSLEVRVPMLGNPVADLVLPQPAHVKMPGGCLKAILKELSSRYLPREVWDRKKHGFSVPLRTYFKGAWREPCNDWLERVQQIAPFLDASSVRASWRATTNRGREARTTYALIILVAWLDRHG